VPLRVGLLALLLAGSVVYSNSLSAPFILDDEESIVRNPQVTRWWPPTDAMRAPPQSSFAGRPLASLSLALSYAFGGLSPAAFRVWNIGFLIASACVLAALINHTMRRRQDRDADIFAIVAALVWLLHPLNTEVVNYVTQRTESLMGLCYLLTLYFASRAIDDTPSAPRWTIASVIACAAGMAVKESMVTAPIMVLIYDAVFGSGSVLKALRRRTALYAGLASTWMLLAYLNIEGPRSGSAGFATATSPVTYLLNQATMIATYLKLSFWPDPLIVDYGRTPALDLAAALPSLILIVAFIAAVAMAWRRHPVAAFLGTWFFVTLAPTSSIVPIATEVGAERRMYLPLMAIVIAILLVVRHSARRPRVVIALAALLAVVLGTITFARNRSYHDPIRMWQDVVRSRPHGRAHYNLAMVLRAAGRHDQANVHFRMAAAADEPHGHYALGFEAAEAGRYGEAARELRAFLQLRPADPVAPQAWLLLGEALGRMQNPAAAEQAFRAALEMSPQYIDAQGKLADVLLQQGRHAEAAAAYRTYLAAMPANPAAHHGLGLAMANSGEVAGAVDVFARAVTLEPRNAEFRTSLGTALASSGRLSEGIAQYREALALAPSNAQVMSALGLALADTGSRDESLALFSRALRIAPEDQTIRRDYATALQLLRRQKKSAP
jgi:tetratricopeptide (TPR) repeat protein